ncbi:tRNA epoxyqueuosine(34) reductase QueG [Synechococcus sp. PCC 7336]|uniref:tRNA epoxyqueuosine(34) reductase QueG n=1 Tax=Synechococcus sp. PCC 7336 TaxID=195250 RepID=UPI0003493A1D|nr:tRNA epoxyqueuosine(34) reductase QueG [Synechococcus sp. PCC 7336]
MHPSAVATAIKQAALKVGFDKVGIAHVDSPPDLSGLNQWLAAGHQADMGWMENPKRWRPTEILPGVRSLVCVALNYYTPHAHSTDPQAGKLSRYAWGRDYHRVLGKRLKALSAWMECEYDCRTRFYVDTGPIAEKAWAMQAGLGWIGKNSLLLTREFGSWIFLGEILTSLDLPPDRPHSSHCGTCSRCLEACPTEAIVADGVVDSNRCIAYHTLESHAAELPEAIAQHLDGWVAGCDICQDVCPWNQRFATPTAIADFEPYPQNLAPPLSKLAASTPEDFSRQFPASALRRLKLERLQRNARAALRTAGDKSHSNSVDWE